MKKLSVCLIAFLMLFSFTTTVGGAQSPDGELGEMIFDAGSIALYEGDCDAPESRLIETVKLPHYEGVSVDEFNMFVMFYVDAFMLDDLQNVVPAYIGPCPFGQHQMYTKASIRVHKRGCTTYTNKLNVCSVCGYEIDYTGSSKQTHTLNSTTCKNWVPKL